MKWTCPMGGSQDATLRFRQDAGDSWVLWERHLSIGDVGDVGGEGSQDAAARTLPPNARRPLG